MDFEYVTAIVLLRESGRSVISAMDSLAGQSRRPDSIVIAGAGAQRVQLSFLEAMSADGLTGMHRGIPVSFIETPPDATLGRSISVIVQNLPPKTTIVSFIGFDSAYAPAKIERSIAILQADPSVVAVTSDFVNEVGRRDYGYPFDWFQVLSRPRHDLNCVVRATVLTRCHAALAPLHHAAAYGLLLCLARMGMIYHTPEVLHRCPKLSVGKQDIICAHDYLLGRFR